MNNLLEKLLEEAKKRADEVEVLYESSKEYSMDVYEGEFETVTLSEIGGVSLKLLKDNKMGMSYSERVDESVIDTLIEQAEMSMAFSPEGQELPLLEGEQKAFGEITKRDIADYKDDLLETEKLIYDKDENIKSVSVAMSLMEHERVLKNSKSLDLSEKSSGGLVHAMVIMNHEGAMEMGFDFQLIEDFSPAELAEKAYREATSGLGAKSVPSKKRNLIINGQTFGMLLSAFGSIFSAEQMQKDMSVLKGKVGEKVSGEALSLTDNPTYEKTPFKKYFDSEGVMTKPFTLIDKGEFKGFLHSRKTAEKEGVESTGHGNRGIKGAVHVSPTTFVVSPGEFSVSELLEELGDGLYIREFQAYHSGMNSVSGDFSLPAKAFLVESGKLTTPVNQITVSGNILDLFKGVKAVAIMKIMLCFVALVLMSL